MSNQLESIRRRGLRAGVSRGALSVAACLGAVAMAGGAWAADGQAAPKTGNTVSEVVVTATKEGNGTKVSKTSISIAAYSQKDLDQASVKTVQALFPRTPGVNFTRQALFGSGFTDIAIRGVQSHTSQPTTGIYVDDTPLYSFGNNTNLGGSNAYPIVFDLARVEVLRGPQGTLFGSGSEGGTVRFITNEPSLTKMSAYDRAEISGTDGAGGANYEAGGAVGGPLVEGKLGFRISADYRHDAGWVDHCVPAVAMPGCLSVAETNANTNDHTVVRGALLWKPTDWLSIEPSFHYQKVHQANPSEIEFAISNPDQGVFRQAHSKDEPVTDQMMIPALKVQADMPNFLGGATATSSSSYVWRKNRFYTDYTQYQDFFFFNDPYPLTGAPDDYGLGKYGIDQNDFFEEFRIASSNPAARLTWVVGAFYQAAHEFDYAHVIHPDLPDLIQNIYGATISQVLGVDPYQGYVAFNEVRTTDKQEAIFANADYKLTDQLKVTVGGRYAHYSESVNSFIAGPFNGTNGETFTGTTSGSTFDPRAVITWQPDSQMLFYVSGAKGYRPGGYNAQVNNAQPACQTRLSDLNLTVPRTYAPDSIWSVEAGAKQRLFDNHLAIDFSVYHNNWDNIQLSEQIADCGFGAVLNLGSAITQGFDLNMESRLGDHVKLNLAVGYTDGHFTKDAFVGDPSKGAPQAVAKGEQITAVPGAIPPWTITAAFEYDFNVMRYGAYFRVEDTYHSKNNGRFAQQEATGTPPQAVNPVVYDPLAFSEPSNNIVNMKLGVRFGSVDASLFADNLANAHPLMAPFHVGQRAVDPTTGAVDSDPRYFFQTFTPRTIGLNLTANF